MASKMIVLSHCKKNNTTNTTSNCSKCTTTTATAAAATTTTATSTGRKSSQDLKQVLGDTRVKTVYSSRGANLTCFIAHAPYGKKEEEEMVKEGEVEEEKE